MTTLKTSSFIINGNKVSVDQVTTGNRDIAYRINGKVIAADAFWRKSPVKVIN